MIRVSQERNDILIRLPADAVEPHVLMRLLDLLNHEIRRPNSVVLASEQPQPEPQKTTKRRKKRKKKPIVIDQLELPFARVS